MTFFNNIFCCLSLLPSPDMNVARCLSFSSHFQDLKQCQLRPTLCGPIDCNPPGSSVHGILQARMLEGEAVPFSRGSSQPKDQTRVFCTAADSLLSKPPGKFKNTGLSSIFLLQQIFPTQELNWGLLNCRRILYQLSYQGSASDSLNDIIKYFLNQRQLLPQQ